MHMQHHRLQIAGRCVNTNNTRHSTAAACQPWQSSGRSGAGGGCCVALASLLPCVPLCPPRFMEAQIHDKEVLIEKLTLKNTTNKAAIAKLEAQLAHKEEMGEVRGRVSRRPCSDGCLDVTGSCCLRLSAASRRACLCAQPARQLC